MAHLLESLHNTARFTTCADGGGLEDGERKG